MCKEYDIKAKIPPKNGAAEHPKLNYMAERNAAIRLIKLYGEDGVKEWKKKVNYGKRCYVESFFSRLKQTFGFNFRNKSEVNREKELRLKCYLLNKFTDIGMAKFEIVIAFLIIVRTGHRRQNQQHNERIRIEECFSWLCFL